MSKEYEESPAGMSDLIYFAIQATRSEGDDRIKYLKTLKNLCKAEIEYEKNKDKPITRFFRKRDD